MEQWFRQAPGCPVGLPQGVFPWYAPVEMFDSPCTRVVSLRLLPQMCCSTTGSFGVRNLRLGYSNLMLGPK